MTCMSTRMGACSSGALPTAQLRARDEATQLLSGSSDAVIPFTLTAESKAGISSN